MDTRIEVDDEPGAVDMPDDVKGEIEFRDVSFAYSDAREDYVLKGVNLKIASGESIALVGPSGAGKTTLLQLIGTLDKPSSGTICFNGEELGKMNESRLATFRNRHIGFVFQFHQLLPEFTALENIIIPALIAGRKRKEAENEAMELLRIMGLEKRAQHKPSEMSGGENQRVAVARALINRPDVILAGEPSGSLDSHNKEELHRLFFDLRDKLGQTFIIVTHDETLAAFTDRTIRMVDGMIENESVKRG
jgi:lipoprotein-releasing system ATP-binding protein